MRPTSLRYLLLVAGLITFVCFPADGQGLTGRMAGAVQDPSSGPIAGAKITLINPATGQQRVTLTDATGEFVFTEVLPGRHDLRIEAPRFRSFEQKGIALASSERLVLPPFVLSLGSINETVTVEAAPTTIETQSSDRSGLIDSRHLQELSLKGRDYLGTLKLLPGILDTASATREAPGNRALIGLFVNGNRQGTLNLALDGISTLSLGGGTGPFLQASIDAVEEVKVLQTNYQAENGRSVGGTIHTVTKSGTRELHGGAYYYFRNEALNANDFFANYQALPRSKYRYNNPGYFVGGPVLFPGSNFNRSRNKLFFFFSGDYLVRTVPSSVSYQTFPTLPERGGDFSQTVDQNGQRIAVRDPATGSPFPGNIVPGDRIDPKGLGLLKIFPAPGQYNAAHTYNTVFQRPIEQPRTDHILRVDWNVAPGTTFYARGIADYQATRGDFGFVLASPAWPQLPVNYEIPCRGIVGTLIHSFGPSRVNELTFGVNRGLQDSRPLNDAALAKNSRSALNLGIPQFYPSANPYGVIPNATFGGIANAAQLNIDARFPYFGRNNVWILSDGYSQIKGAHSLKAGFYLEKSAVNESNGTFFNGTFAFDRDPNNPLDTGYAFANALTGSVTSYTESDGQPAGHVRDLRVEWYAQDTWRVSKRFTIDAGMRFYWLRPNLNAFPQTVVFDPQGYSRAEQPPLIQPYIDPATSTRVGRDPVTGQLFAAVKIGSFSTAAGKPYQGMRVYGNGENAMRTPPIQVAPRFGFAWDVFGNHKTAIRSGFGMYYDRFPDDQMAQLVAQPPLLRTPSATYTTLSNLLASQLSLSPNTVWGLDGNWKPLAVYNWSFGVQQSLGSGFVLDVAYVGNVTRHAMHVRDLNANSYGVNFRPSSIDPTLPGNRALPPNFLRPYFGFGSIQYMEFASNATYHGLQSQLRRRLSAGLTVSAAYTWSKVLDFVDAWTAPVNPSLDFTSRNYGPAGYDRKHNFSASWVYQVRPLAGHSTNKLATTALNGWEVSGIVSFISGAPTPINYSFVNAIDVTGAAGVGIDSRVDLTCDPSLSRGEKSFSKTFNTSCIQAPTVAGLGIGNAPKFPFVGPGVNNLDLSLFKTFRFGADGTRRAQFRLESYNAFNHAQFTGVDNNARFDSAGKQVNLALSQYLTAAPARRVVLGLKLYF